MRAQVQIEKLQKQWREKVRFRGLHASLSLEKDGLVLGAQTVLAKRAHDGGLEADEARLLTLLAVAYGGPVDVSVLGSVRRASKQMRAGDECLAAMHIALAGLPKLADPSDAARRIFIADNLLADGVSPRDIWAALEFDSAPLDALEKYNSDEPRIPAGSGRPSGQWTSGESSSGAEGFWPAIARAGQRALQEVIPEAPPATAIFENVPELLLDLARLGSGPIAFLGALLYSTPAGGRHQEGEVPGRPDLRYSWNEDETQLEITRASDGQVVVRATLGPDGNFRVRQSRAIARLLNEHVLVDPETLPPEDPRSSQRKDEPDLCPEPPLPDSEGSANSIRYANYMKLLVNFPPTPPGFGYRLYNPFSNGDVVKYDDCERDEGAMDEYKGQNYAKQMAARNRYYGEQFEKDLADAWLDQATRQIEASGGRPVKWYFAEQPALDFARDLFAKHPILRRIKLIYAPPPWGPS